MTSSQNRSGSNLDIMPKSNTFCPLPFFQVVIRTDGSMSPCCLIKGNTNIKNSNIIEFWSSDDLKNIKDSMIDGTKPIDKCEICYRNERTIGKSMRTEALMEYKFLNENLYSKLIDHYGYLDKKSPSWLEMHLGNTCNLKCLTCRPEDSSMFLQENRVIGISNHKQSDYVLDDSIVDCNIDLVIENLTVLDLRGGESLLIPSIKRKLARLPSSKCKDKILKVQTNGTILDEVWKDIFKKFQSVKIMLSIDAFNKDNEYIRYPADWSKIEENIAYFKSANYEIYINCTVSNLNFLLLDKLLQWVDERKIYFHYSTLEHPEYYHFFNLPKELFEMAKLKLEPWVEKYPTLQGLLLVESSTNKWNEFCSIINKRDSYRKNSIFEILPELKEYWYAQK